ncbi:MAG: serine/threonine protein kinase [Alphaproteobacteria bacterium]|nr:serine/threonine protein kinase [Alphaproteobacteria bacterium]
MAKRSKHFAPWRMVSEIPGGGGQGDLYLVRHESGIPAGEFVLKWLKNPHRQVRFENELKSLQAVSGHPHVVALADSAALLGAEGRFYVMEKADGSLESLAPDQGYDTSRALALFREILLGVEALHAAGVIHRDLKPANILLVNNVAKVADTGLCLIVGEFRATPTDEAVGPRYYMAPELEHGRNLDVDFRADLYSLGKLLYWLLSGGVNLPRETFNDPERRLWRTRSPGFEAFHRIFDKTLTIHPSTRFKSATALLSAFDDAVATYAMHADTRMMTIVASAPNFQTAFAQMSDDERSAAFKRLKHGLLDASVDSLIDVARVADTARHEDILSALEGRLDPEDSRVADLALLFAASADGLDALFPVMGRSTLTRPMIVSIIEQGDEAQRLALASEIASPFSSVDDLIPELLRRLPTPISLPDKLIGSMATTPRYADHPSLIDVMRRASEDPDSATGTLVLVAHALANSTDPAARSVLDQVVSVAKTRPEALPEVASGLIGGPAGLSVLSELATDPSIPEAQQRLLQTLLSIAQRVRDESAAEEDGDN